MRRKAPAHGIQLKTGRLVVPVWLSTGTCGHAHRPSVTSTIYSDDHGKTWQRGEIAVPNTDEWIYPNETVIVELVNGMVTPNVLSESKKHRRIIVQSLSITERCGLERPHRLRVRQLLTLLLFLRSSAPRLLAEKFHRLLVDREDDAARLTHHTVMRAGGVDAQGARVDGAALIPLAAREYKDVLPAIMIMGGYATLPAEPDQRRGGAGDAISVQAHNVHPITEVLPGQILLMLCDVEEILQLDERKSRGGG